METLPASAQADQASKAKSPDSNREDDLEARHVRSDNTWYLGRREC